MSGTVRAQIVGYVRRLVDLGHVPGLSGNVSVRLDDGTVLATPSGLDYARMEPEDITHITIDGERLSDGLAPSSEVPMHLSAYRNDDRVKAVVHAHPRYCTVLSCLGLEIPPIHYTLTAICTDGRVRLAPYALYGSEDMAKASASMLDADHHACLLANHGVTVVGATLEQAFIRTLIVEEAAAVYFTARLGGTPNELTPEQIAEVGAKIAGYGQSK